MSMADQFEPLEIIGRGSFGLIRKARRKSDGKILARKEISYRQMNVKEKNQLMAEFRILKSLVYPNIVRYYYHDHVVQEHSVHLYMEYCDGGDLAGIIRNCKQSGEYVPESLVWSIFTQLTLALYRCHYNSDPPPPDEIGSNTQTQEPPIPSTIILHRDIKPDNVFLDQHNTVKLGDFGLAKILDQEHALANTYVGTPYYMSPEVLNDQPSIPQSDVWSLGCVIYELCAKHPPFQAKSHMQLSQRIKEGTYPPLPHVYSDLLGSTIASCLTQDSRARPTTAALLHTSMFNFCRKERQVESLQRDLEAERLEIDQARKDIEEERNLVESARCDLDNREQTLKTQEEDLAVERDTLLRQVQEEKELLQLQMKSFNEEFEQRVDQEVQRQLELVTRGKRPSSDNPANMYPGSEGKQGRSDGNNYNQSPLIGSTFQFQSNETGAAPPVQSTPHATRSGVKGPRLIRDSSLNSNKSRSPRKYYNSEDETSVDSQNSNFLLERKMSGQSLASHTSHTSHQTSISRMGSNASASSRITSPVIPSHHSFEPKPYLPLQQSPKKSSGSQTSQQYLSAHMPLPLNTKTTGRNSPEKDTEMTSPVRTYAPVLNLQTRHLAQPMDDSSNSSPSAYSLQSSHISASSASSVENEGNGKLSNDFSKQTLAGYPASHPQSQQGQTHNLHMFEATHNPTRSSSTRTEGYTRTKNDIQSLDDGSVTTLQDSNSQNGGSRFNFRDGAENIDENGLLETDPNYGSFKPKRSISSPIKSSAHMGRTSPTKSAAAMAMMIEAHTAASSARNFNNGVGSIATQHVFSNRVTHLKSPVTIFSPATPRDRQAPHYQAIYSTSSSGSGGERSRHASPEKDTSRTNSPLLEARNSLSHSKSTSSSSSARSRTPPLAIASNLKLGSSSGSSVLREENGSPALNELDIYTSRHINSTGSSPKKHSPTRKPVKPVNKAEDLSLLETPKPKGSNRDPQDSNNTNASNNCNNTLNENSSTNTSNTVSTDHSPPSTSGLSRRGGIGHGRIASSDRNKDTFALRKEDGSLAGIGIGIKNSVISSAPTSSREKHGIVAAGFVKRRCETWDENWNGKNESNGNVNDNNTNTSSANNSFTNNNNRSGNSNGGSNDNDSSKYEELSDDSSPPTREASPNSSFKRRERRV